MQHSSFVAAVNVPVSVFVKRDSDRDFAMRPCVAGDVADIGISNEGTQDTLLPGYSGPHIAANAGYSCRVYCIGETCEIFAGDQITAGDFLKPDDNGHAVPALEGETYSAISNQSVPDSGVKVTVTVDRGIAPAPGSESN